MGKKSKVDRKTKSGRHEEVEEEFGMDVDNEDEQWDETNSVGKSNVDRVGQDDKQIDMFLDAVENMDNKKAQTRIKALNSLISTMQSGADLFERVNSNMDTLVENLKRYLNRRTSDHEATLAMKVVAILSLVSGAESDSFAEEFTPSLTNLATRSSIEDVDIRIAAVRTLAFIHFVCCGGSSGYPCFGLIGEIALNISDGTDACPELQVAAADAWCLLANMMDPQKVCDLSLEEDMFQELVTLLGSSNTETQIKAGQCLAMLWEVADQVQPGVDATVSAALICNDDDVVQEVMQTLKQIGKESSKKINKKNRKERKNALKNVSDWILDGNPPEGDDVHLQGGDVQISTFGEARVMDYLRWVLKGGIQSCLRNFPVTRDMLGVEYFAFDDENDTSEGVAGGGGVKCDAFDKRFVRSQVGKVKSKDRRNQRADKELLQSDCY